MAKRTQKNKNNQSISKKKSIVNKKKKNTKSKTAQGKKKSNSQSQLKFDKNFIKEAIKKPDILKHLIPGLSSRDIKKVATSSKVFNEITKINPKLMLKYGKKITPLLKSKHSPTRSQTTHTLSLIAKHSPQLIGSILKDLDKIINTDRNVTTRDNAIQAIAHYASTSKKAAKKAYPYLKKAMKQWNERHASQAMRAINDAWHYLIDLKNEIQEAATSFIDSSSATVKKEAKRLLKLANI